MQGLVEGEDRDSCSSSEMGSNRGMGVTGKGRTETEQIRSRRGQTQQHWCMLNPNPLTRPESLTQHFLGLQWPFGNADLKTHIAQSGVLLGGGEKVLMPVAQNSSSITFFKLQC